MVDPLVVSAERRSNGMIYWSRITVEIPSDFDFKKDGPKLLRDIQSAANLFSEEKEE